MKKLLFMLVALMATVMTFAQTNLTSGKTVVPLGGLKTYTSNDGTQSYTIKNDDLQKITQDGNEANIYLFPEVGGGGYSNEANQAIGIQGFYIDMGESKSVGSIQSTWEGANCGANIYVTDTEPAADGSLTGETLIATFDNAGGNVKNTATNVDNSGRYIVFVPTIATNYGWGVKIRTFAAFEKQESVLTSLTVSPTFVNAGVATTVTLQAADQVGGTIAGVTYSVTGGTLDGNTLTVTADKAVITATYGENTASATVYSIPDAPDAPTIDAELVLPVYSTTYSKGMTDPNPGWGVGGGAPNPFYKSLEELTIGDIKVVHVTGAGFNSRTQGSITPGTDYGTVHATVYPTTATTCKIFWDNTYGQAVSAEVTPGQWNYIEIPNVNFQNNYTLIELVGETEFLLADFYFSTDAPIEPAVPFDYDTPCNLWKTANKTISWYYAPGWTATDAPEVTENNGVYTFNLSAATWERWQAQLSITSDIATNTENNYDMSATIRVSKPVTVAFQLGTGYEYVNRDYPLKANEDFVIRFDQLSGKNLNNIKFFVDFGGNQADTEVTISNIVFKESDCDENAEITAIDIKNRNEIPSEIYVEEGGQITIIDQDGNDVTPGFITFTSSDDTKITVDAQGNVEAIAATEPGSTVTITAALTSNPDITTEISFTIVEDLLHVDYVGEDGIVVLAGSWNMDLFKNIDAEQKATAYDFTKVKNIPDATNNNESTKNPNAFFISPVAGKFRKNEVVRKDADGYQGYNIQIIDFFGDTEDHSVNTHIAPITVTDPVFLRIFNTTGIYATVVLPWIGKIQNNVRFYELTNANTADGVTTLVFSEAGVTAAPEAGKPYVVYVDQSAGADLVMIGGGEQTITWNNNNSGAGSDIVFRGTFEKVAKADNQYTLNGTMAEPEFGKNMFDIPAFRGYIQKENGINGSAKFEVFFSDATGIHRATTDQLNAVFNIYSIDGKVIQRNADSMINLKKGVYIINGKKTVVK